MHDFLLEVRRVGTELRNEYGAVVSFAASVLICVSAGWNIARRIGRGIRALWRRWWPVKEEEDTWHEGA